MKRVIKFRGKAIKDKQWVFGDFKSDGTFIANHRVDPRTTTQFTGCYDRNGVEIFEGDILRFLYKKYTWLDREAYVFYNDGEWMCQSADKEANPTCIFPGNKAGIYDIEVVGNVFDNPEFFKPKHT